MKTTLILPPDVAHTLRMESAKRGGRKSASLSSLVSDAVREMYGGGSPPRIRLTPGRVIVGASGDAPAIDSKRVAEVLYDEIPGR